MKFILAVIAAILLVGASAAPTSAPDAHKSESRAVAELLILRAEHHSAQTMRLMDDLRKTGHAHLLRDIEEQVVLIEGLVNSLKMQLQNPDLRHHLHHFHVIEEELLIHENRIAEELEAIREIRENHKHHELNAEQLIQAGELIIKKGEEALKKHSHLREGALIQSEIKQIKALIKDLETKKNKKPEELVKGEQQLAKHELSLKQLIEKAEIRNPSHTKHN